MFSLISNKFIHSTLQIILPDGKKKYMPHQLRNYLSKATHRKPRTIGRWIQYGSTYSLLGGAGMLVLCFTFQVIYVYSRKYLSTGNFGLAKSQSSCHRITGRPGLTTCRLNSMPITWCSFTLLFLYNS